MIKAKKSLSQNFITDKNICNKIVKLLLIKNKIVIEIGPGLGFLTDFILYQNPKKIYLIEKDNKLSLFLKNKYKNDSRVEIINDDIFNINFNIYRDINIISNLPYNISTKLIIYLFKFSLNINEMVFMIQKEVAYKFDYNIVKINKYKFLTKLICEYKRCFNVPPSVFYPKPKVNSTVVKFSFIKKINNMSTLIKFIDLVFKNKRKKISNKINISNQAYNKILDKRIDEIKMDELLRIYNFFDSSIQS